MGITSLSIKYDWKKAHSTSILHVLVLSEYLYIISRSSVDISDKSPRFINSRHIQKPFALWIPVTCCLYTIPDFMLSQMRQQKRNSKYCLQFLTFRNLSGGIITILYRLEIPSSWDANFMINWCTRAWTPFFPQVNLFTYEKWVPKGSGTSW